MFERKKTRQVKVGNVLVGGDARVSIQSMTTTKTSDVEGTLQQIYALRGAGCDIVRCTRNEIEAAEGLAQIIPRSPLPIVADIHFQYKLALAAMEAGVHALRLNPGNIRKPEQIKIVASEARDRGIPIRIGVNAGSLDPALYEKYGGATPEALVESAVKELRYFEEVGFDDVKISVKASNIRLMVDSYRLLSETVDYPLHLGVTEAGPMPNGLIKSVAGIATLLNEGIGDTVRFSLTADPVEEAKAAVVLLESLELRERTGLDLIAVQVVVDLKLMLSKLLVKLKRHLKIKIFHFKLRLWVVWLMGQVKHVKLTWVLQPVEAKVTYLLKELWCVLFQNQKWSKHLSMKRKR